MSDEPIEPDMTTERAVEFLTMHRIVYGLTLREVGEAAGLAPSTIMRWERGENRVPLESLAAWADALGFVLAVTLRPKPPTGGRS